MDSSLSGERSNQEKQKKRVSCNHQGFTFSAKETEIGDKKKGGKKGEPVTIGLSTLNSFFHFFTFFGEEGLFQISI
jgi:hypothetical protein